MSKLISTIIGDGMPSNPDDVITIRSVLNGLGYDDPNPDFGYIDKRLSKNIKSFQNDNDLKVDGILYPGGPTEAAMISAMDDGDIEEAARSPTFWCPECGGPHGGVHDNNKCDWCNKRGQNEDDAPSDEGPEVPEVPEIEPIPDIIIG